MIGRIFVVAGPSGAGKTTLESRLLKEFPEISYSVSATTRPPRPGEVHGRDYFFVDRDEFDRMIEAGELAEWAEFYGNRYGTPLAPLKEAVGAGHDLLIDVEVDGLAQLRRNLGQAIYVLVLPPSARELTKRLTGRSAKDQTTGPEQIKTRLQRAGYELGRMAELIDRYNPERRAGGDFIIVNDDLETAYDQLRAVVLASRLAPDRQMDFLINLKNEVS